MSSSLNHAVHIQIKTLVQSLSNKKSMRNAKNELLNLVDLCGLEARRYMFICLLESLDFKDPKVQSGTKEQTKIQFLTQQLTICGNHPNFLDYFTQVIEHVIQKQNLSEYLNDVIKCLKLPLTLQITMALSVAFSPSHQIAKEGVQIVKSKLVEYFQIGKPLQFPENILSSLLYIVRSNPELEEMSEEVKFLVETNCSDKSYDFKPLFVKGLENSIVSETKDVLSLMKFTPHKLKPYSVLQDLGPSCTQSIQSLTQVLSDFPEMDEEAILESLLMMHNSPVDTVEDEEARTLNHAFQAVKAKIWTNVLEDNSVGRPNASWNIDNFIKVCSDRYPNTKWSQVIKWLDRPGFTLRDTQALISLFKSFQKLKKFATFNFPPSVLFERWKNPSSQAEFLIKLIQAGQPDSVFFNECSKRIVSLDLYPNLKISSLNPPMLQFFSCLDFLEILIELSESDYYPEIRALFDLPLTRCPDLLILGLAQIRPKVGMPLLDELLSHLLPLYLSNHASSMEILEAIWKINPQIMISAFSELYKRDNSSLNLSRVLDISQEIKDSLLPIVNCRDYSFSVSLGILAAKRDFLHLDQWIAKRVRAIGNPFISAIFKYLDEHIFEPCRNTHQSQYDTILERSQLSLESLVIIFQTLMNPNLEGKMSSRNKLLLAERYKDLCQFFPNIITDTPWTEIEATANSLFEQTFEEKLSIPELIEIMLRYKSSNNEKEKNILLCMMTNLLDEARFFPNYKPKILMIMAQIYGAVINNNLVEGQARDVTFKIIVESMKHREDRKQLDFGVKALEIFKGRLHEWPTKAVQLFSIDNLRENYFELLEEIRYNLEAKGIQLDIPPEYVNYANMRAQEKNRAMARAQAQGYPQVNQPRVGMMPPMVQDPMFGAQAMNKGGLPPMYEGRGPMTGALPQGYPPSFDANLKNQRFSGSQIEEISMNFEKININPNTLGQPGMGGQVGVGQPIPNMIPGSGFAGFGGMPMGGLGGLTGPGGFGGLGGMRMNEPINSPPTAISSATHTPPLSATSTAPVTRRGSNETLVSQAAASQTTTQSVNQPTSQPPSQPVTLESLLKAFDKEFTDLPEELKNRIIFALNNCSNSNLEEKSNELRGYLNDEKVIKWFAKYIVYQRAPLESNFHSMYIGLVERLGRKEIFSMMIKETANLLNKVLESDRIFGSPEKTYIQGNDKNNLKNLGSWLGHLTIARNKPIVMKDFDVKNLILEGYENQKLDYVLPLVCKILTHGIHPNSVFKPKNAWMNAILSILEEIDQMAEIKMALKCEVQVLKKKFGINEGEVIPSKLIQNRKMQKKTTSQRGPDLQDINGQNRSIAANESQLTINELPQYVTVDQKVLALIPTLKNIVAQALDRAIKEILPPVISRSVTIALITTKELVLKDFAVEPDEKKLVKGATLIVQNLAGNLALVTCREPLKIAFQQTLKTILDQLGLDEKTKEDIIHNTSVDNLDLGCALIKKAVIEKALEDVQQDVAIAEAVEKRRMSRETGMLFYDETTIKIYESLPQALKPSVTGLTKDQMRIYEEFGKITKSQEPKELRKTGLKMEGKSEKRLDPESIVIIQRFEQYVFQLDRTLENLAADQNNEKIKEIQIAHKNTMEMIHNYGNYDEIPFECAVKLLEPLFNEQVSIKKINFFLAVLKDLKHLNENLPTDLLQWILVPTEKRLLKADILLKLIKDNFVNVPELDQGFLDILEASANNVQFCLSIIKIIKVLVVDEKLLSTSHFQKTIDHIFNNIKVFKEAHPKVEKYIEDFKNAISYIPNLNNQTRPKLVQPMPDSLYKATLQQALGLFTEKDEEYYEQAYKKLEEWLMITSESEMPGFIKVIETTIFQAAGDTLTRFFAFMTDICVDHALSSANRMNNYGKLHHNPAMDFSYIDAFSKLVILLLKTVINTNKNEILEKILQSVILTLTKNHELHRENFNQRPFFRLFYNLLFDINRREYTFTQQEITQFLVIFMKAFDALQPIKYPGFAFSWLELISNRYFMPLILMNSLNKQENWRSYAMLIIGLFKFFKETMEGDAYKAESYKLFYKGTLRALLVILHDFPEFFIEAGFILVENLPDKFNQVRNIIFSAFPKTMQPPDPFRVTDQIELRDEFRVLPNNLFNFEERIVSTKLHEEIVKYLTAKNDANEIYFRNICSKFLTSKEANNNEVKINQPVVNAFVLFVPWMIYKTNDDYQKINEFKTASYSLFWKLLVSSNPQMRETLINSIMNQIRYPNPITFYFTNLIFYIFSIPQTDESLLEQIIKIFIERLIIERPHPWGIMYAFIELIKEKEVFRKRTFFKNTEFEEMIKYVFKVMGKGDSNEN